MSKYDCPKSLVDFFKDLDPLEEGGSYEESNETESVQNDMDMDEYIRHICSIPTVESRENWLLTEDQAKELLGDGSEKAQTWKISLILPFVAVGIMWTLFTIPFWPFFFEILDDLIAEEEIKEMSENRRRRHPLE